MEENTELQQNLYRTIIEMGGFKWTSCLIEAGDTGFPSDYYLVRYWKGRKLISLGRNENWAKANLEASAKALEYLKNQPED